MSKEKEESKQNIAHHTLQQGLLGEEQKNSIESDESFEMLERRPRHKSTFAAYVKPNFYRLGTTEEMQTSQQLHPDHDQEHGMSDPEDTERKQQLENQRQKIKQRVTDGYFNTSKAKGVGFKTKKHIYGRKATYLPKADKKRISMRIVDQYRTYPLNYIDYGYGGIINVLIWICNVYMHYFSNLMRFLGGLVDKLQENYSANNVGYAMMTLSILLYLVPTIFIKCSKTVDFSLAVMARGLIAMILIFQMAHVTNTELTRFPGNDITYLTYKGVLTAVSQLYFFFTLGKLPLSINMIISNTGPIFVFIISVFFFNGEMHRKDFIGILIAVAGVLCVSNPQFVHSLFYKDDVVIDDTSATSIQPPKYQYAEGSERYFYIIVFLVIYVGWAYGVLVVKKLEKANTLAMNFFVALSFFLVGAFTLFFRPSTIFDLSLMDIFNLFFTIGLFAFGSQYTFITSTFLNHNHGPLTMLGYLNVVLSYIIQIIFFGEIPSTIEIIGSVLVLLGVAKILIN